MRPVLLATTFATLIGLTAACARPAPGRPVGSEAEAVAIARAELTKVGEGQAALTVTRDGQTWTVATPRRYIGPDFGQTIVRIDIRTGKAALGSFQTAHIDVDLQTPER